MTARHPLRCIAIAIVVALLGAGNATAQKNTGQAGKKLYCWNEGGRKVCGDALPAEAADSARTEISPRSGLRTAQYPRALTEGERADALIAAEAARRQAEAEAMRVRRDLAMVESYMTEADLRRAYGERTALLDESLKASALGVSNLRLSLLGLLRQAGDHELAANPVPRKLADAVLEQHRELRRQHQIMAAQRRDRAELENELTDAVQRYRALKTPPAQAGANPGSGLVPPAGG